MEQNQQCPPQSNDVFSPGPSGKSRGVAALLAIFLDHSESNISISVKIQQA